MPSERETFIKVNDRMPEHPKVEGLSDKAFRSLMNLWCWCSRNKTDGHVPAGTWRTRAPGKAGRELIEAGLAAEIDGEVWMHDYLKHQRSREQIEALSVKRAQAGRQGGRPAASEKQAGSKVLNKPEAGAPPYRDRGGTTYLPDRQADETTESEAASAATDADGDRDDVDGLCKHLADRIEGNGSRRPTITKRWRTEARLLLDRDGRDLDKAHNLIDWCQEHHIWKSAVLAMPKFRNKYDQMRLQALEDHKRNGGGRLRAVDDGVDSTANRRVAAAVAVAQRYREREHAEQQQLEAGS